MKLFTVQKSSIAGVDYKIEKKPVRVEVRRNIFGFKRFKVVEEERGSITFYLKGGNEVIISSEKITKEKMAEVINTKNDSQITEISIMY